ncbi:hypothetical protein [Streptomyces sp. NPDC051014]|uniref:hypothetical protein n=1 Tax=Streptomyces sp. NPDC051014 TaxID=3155751 RepID=UPI0033E993A8
MAVAGRPVLIVPPVRPRVSRFSDGPDHRPRSLAEQVDRQRRRIVRSPAREEDEPTVPVPYQEVLAKPYRDTTSEWTGRSLPPGSLPGIVARRSAQRACGRPRLAGRRMDDHRTFAARTPR